MFAHVPIRLARPFATLLLVTLLLPVLAFAQTPTVGFYWDTGHNITETEVTEYPAFLTAYLVIHGVPEGVLGWELCTDIEGPGSYVGLSLEGQAINASADPGCYAVGLAEPLPDGPDGILVATATVMVTEQRPVTLELKQTFRPTIPGAMAYLSANDPDHPRVLETVTGSAPVAWINAEVPWAEINPSGLNFDAAPTGITTVRDLTVTNAGGGVLALEVALPDSCAAFSLPGLSGSVLIPGGQSRVIEVGFTPPDLATYQCLLDLGSAAPDIYLYGIGREPITSWSLPAQVAFGEVVTGYTRTKNVQAVNTGETVIRITPSLPESVNGLSISSGATPVDLAPGEAYTVVLTFAPTESFSFDTVLDLGDVLPDVRLYGTARDPRMDWSISPTALNFNVTAVGLFREARVRIVNTGDIVFEGEAAFVGVHPAFEIFDGGGPFTLYPGQERSVWVRFTPEDLVPYESTLSMGDLFPTVPVTGTGALYSEDCNISPAIIDFGSVEVGRTLYRTFEIHNPGTAPLEVDPRVSSPHFSVTPNPRTIQPGNSVWYTVRFHPAYAGTHEVTVDPGNGSCPDVRLVGTGLGNSTACAVTPDTLFFGPVNLGRSASLLLHVENTGDLTLNFTPEISRTEFVLAGGLMQLQRGQSTSFNVTFTPQEAGTTTATLYLGSVCAPVVLVGEAITGFQPWENLVGIYFDRDFTESEFITEIPLQEVTGHLVLHNPSDPSGVGAWELEARVTGPGTILGWQFSGDHINVGQYNELIVGIGGQPLVPDPSGAVLLATFHLLVEEPFPTEVTLQIGPVYQASLPGLMSWVSWDDANEVIPMVPHTGIETVGWINNNALPVQDVPAPLALQIAGRVTLQWPRPEGDDLAFHVYRRQGPVPAERLTEQPLRQTGAVLDYTDPAAGIAPGTVLHYRYSLVEDGLETLMSPETAVTLGGVPALANRLLPNVPNPFNPSTRVRFELKEAGPARVAIFDLAGRRVRTLVQADLAAGPHERVWDGRDESGRAVPSGAYYARLVTDSRVDHLKMMLLK